MKVTVKEITIQDEYPYIGISEDRNVVVFFTGENTGICLQPGNTNRTFGEFDSTWLESRFTSFQGEIVLSNS